MRTPCTTGETNQTDSENLISMVRGRQRIQFVPGALLPFLPQFIVPHPPAGGSCPARRRRTIDPYKSRARSLPEAKVGGVAPNSRSMPPLSQKKAACRHLDVITLRSISDVKINTGRIRRSSRRFSIPGEQAGRRQLGRQTPASVRPPPIVGGV